MMKNLHKMGGIAALYEALAYVVAMVGYLLVVGDVGIVDPIQKVTSLVDNQAFTYILNLFTYIVFGLFLVVLALALYERLKVGSPALVQIATAIGLVWACLVIASGMVANVGMDTVVDLYGQDPAQAALTWSAIDSVALGLGGAGGEILGGIWILLASWAALQAGQFPKALNYLGVAIGVVGLISVVPVLGELRGLIFGLGQIVWFVWLGIVILRKSPGSAA
jgi:Domain of unknown function (DUF4386)